MTDTRFETVFEDTDDLLGGVDVDEIGDVETLLMVLFARPVVVEEEWGDEAVAPSLEVVIQGNDEAIGSVYAFPLSLIESTRSCAETVDELGPYTRDGVAEESLDVSAMSWNTRRRKCSVFERHRHPSPPTNWRSAPRSCAPAG